MSKYVREPIGSGVRIEWKPEDGDLAEQALKDSLPAGFANIPDDLPVSLGEDRDMAAAVVERYEELYAGKYGQDNPY